MPLLVPFGLKDGRLYEPLQVENGKACDCVCPGCHHPLIARQNALTPHFAHVPGEDCAIGFETAIHMAAKQLIGERMKLSIPAVVLQYPGGYGERPSTQDLYMSHVKSLSDVRFEPWLGGGRPDILVIEASGKKEILIEIAVTHFVDEAKLAKIKSRGTPAIEINVSVAHERMDFALLESLLFEVPSRGRWLYHPEAFSLEQRYIAKRAAVWETRQTKEMDRFDSYRRYNPREKLRRNIAKAGINESTLRSLTAFVPGEGAYVGGRLVWQSAVLAYIANLAKEDGFDGRSVGIRIDKENLDSWLSKTFDLTPAFPDAEKIAAWKYLEHLEALGLLRYVQGTSFQIMMSPQDYRPKKSNPRSR